MSPIILLLGAAVVIAIAASSKKKLSAGGGGALPAAPVASCLPGVTVPIATGDTDLSGLPGYQPAGSATPTTGPAYAYGEALMKCPIGGINPTNRAAHAVVLEGLGLCLHDLGYTTAGNRFLRRAAEVKAGKHDGCTATTQFVEPGGADGGGAGTATGGRALTTTETKTVGVTATSLLGPTPGIDALPGPYPAYVRTAIAAAVDPAKLVILEASLNGAPQAQAEVARARAILEAILAAGGTGPIPAAQLPASWATMVPDYKDSSGATWTIAFMPATGGTLGMPEQYVATTTSYGGRALKRRTITELTAAIEAYVLTTKGATIAPGFVAPGHLTPTDPLDALVVGLPDEPAGEGIASQVRRILVYARDWKSVPGLPNLGFPYDPDALIARMNEIDKMYGVTPATGMLRDFAGMLKMAISGASIVEAENKRLARRTKDWPGLMAVTDPVYVARFDPLVRGLAKETSTGGAAVLRLVNGYVPPSAEDVRALKMSFEIVYPTSHTAARDELREIATRIDSGDVGGAVTE